MFGCMFGFSALVVLMKAADVHGTTEIDRRFMDIYDMMQL